ncbi:MAG: protein kinase [Bryobacterales bacterium]|nr:protein kinase [Bryobacterales bacterium]
MVTIYRCGTSRTASPTSPWNTWRETAWSTCSKSAASSLAQMLLSLLRQMAEALDFAHSRGIVHRDIKPPNIMVTPTGRVRITDFGIAKIAHASSVTQGGGMLGTPDYMSPEQIAGSAIDGRSDQFSLGVIAFELLSGEKPFVAETLPALLYRIAHQPSPDATLLNRSLSPAIGKVLERAMAKEAADRFPSCLTFVDALAEACATSPGWHALPRGMSQTPRRWAMPRKRRLSPLAILRAKGNLRRFRLARQSRHLWPPVLPRAQPRSRFGFPLCRHPAWRRRHPGRSPPPEVPHGGAGGGFSHWGGPLAIGNAGRFRPPQPSLAAVTFTKKKTSEAKPPAGDAGRASQLPGGGRRAGSGLLRRRRRRCARNTRQPAQLAADGSGDGRPSSTEGDTTPDGVTPPPEPSPLLKDLRSPRPVRERQSRKRQPRKRQGRIPDPPWRRPNPLRKCPSPRPRNQPNPRGQSGPAPERQASASSANRQVRK